MKYTIIREFSFNNEKYQVVSDSKSICTVKASRSKDYKEQFCVKLSNPFSKHMGEDYCIVEPDSKQSQNYLIYLKNDQSNAKNLFGQLLCQTCSYNNYLYTIIIGQKLYKVRSCDMKDRRLVVVDAIQADQSNQYSASDYPEILYQVIDSFSKANKKYHVNIHDKEWPLGYLAITILLDLHECRRNVK